MTDSITKSSVLRSPQGLLAGLCAVLVLWFLALYPLMPATLLGWGVAILAGVVVFLWVWGCIELIVWLERPRRYQLLFKIFGYPIACSLGVGVFLIAYCGRDFISRNFAYFFH
jgi:hypothetical protein